MTAVHQRAVIRDAVVAVLAAAGTAAGKRVYDTVYDPRTDFPALCVEDAGEDQSVVPVYAAGRAGRKIERTLALTITAEIQQTTHYARERDGLLAQVEVALANAVIAGVTDIRPAGYRTDLSVIANVPITMGQQRYTLTYTTTQGNPAISI